MTLVTFHVQKHRVDVVTDSIAYTSDAALVRHTSKVLHFSHVRCLLVGHGSGHLSDLVSLRLLNSQGDDVDDIAPQIEQILPDSWAHCVAAGSDSDSTNYILGYSTKRKRFTGYEFHSSRNAPPRILHKAISVELADRSVGGDGSHRFEVWPDPLGGTTRHVDLPETDNEWIDLAVQARRSQLTVPSFSDRVLIAGHLTRTTLDVDGCTQRRIHTFDDDGDEYTELLAGSANPRAVAPREWAGVGRNDPCPCGSGRKYKVCRHLPGAAQ